LITTSYPAFRGDPSGHFVATEARSLARSCDVFVLAPAPADGHGLLAHSSPCIEDGGVGVFRVPGHGAFGWPGAGARMRAHPWRVGGAVIWARDVRSLAHELGPFDRVVAHWALPCGFPIATGAALAPSCEVELVSHGGDVRLLAHLPAPVRRRALHRLLGAASSWRFVSVALKDELMRALEPDERRRLEQIASIHAASIELAHVAERSRSLWPAHRSRPLYALVGRLVAAKRFDRALEHVASVSPRPHVVVVGDGPERSRLEADSDRLGLTVRFTGLVARDEALAWIGASDALVHASRKEGLSTVVREAESLGVRVLVVP
jgi:glycosyltransferase involved in cell wall biosynthesis